IPILISHFCMTALYKFLPLFSLSTQHNTTQHNTHTQLQNVHFSYSNKVAPIQYWSVLTTLHSSDTVVSTLQIRLELSVLFNKLLQQDLNNKYGALLI
ncbi:unnamed protein product, partial [Oikopleura dioica]